MEKMNNRQNYPIETVGINATASWRC